MSEQLTTVGRQDDASDDMRQSGGVTAEEAQTIDSNADTRLAQDDASASAPGAESAARQRRLRRSSASDTRRGGEDFNPTSRGDENGEVM